MNIADADIKKLWGLAAGFCSFPGCSTSCVQVHESSGSTLVGEMAHIIARQPSGPRGQASGGSNRYNNLILLCPTHHTLVDNAEEGIYPVADLLRWKAEHEASVRTRLAAPTFDDKQQLAKAILFILIENHAAWRAYGPESVSAATNPFSNDSELWTIRKLTQILPNNRKAVNLIRQNSRWFSAAEYEICVQFIEHVEGFEASTYDRKDSVPRFPRQFEEMIRRVASE